MIPILYISKSKIKTNAYIKALCKKNSIDSFAVYEVYKETTRLKIDQIRELILFISNNTSSKLCICVHDFETSSDEVQNSILKILEEHDEKCHIILVSKSLYSILSTIKSRCKIVFSETKNTVKKSDTIQPDLSIENTSKLTKIALLERMLEIMHYVSLRSKKECIQGNYSYSRHATSLLNEMIYTYNAVDKYNVNAEIALDHILLEMEQYNILLS